MKKLLFAAFATILCTTISYQSFALFGIHINYERGAKEWNGDHTATECVGRGCCKFSVDFNASVKAPSVYAGSENGTFGIRIERSVIEQYPDDFLNDQFMVTSDQVLPLDFAQQCGLDREIRILKGSYPLQWQENGDAIVMFP